MRNRKAAFFSAILLCPLARTPSVGILAAVLVAITNSCACAAVLSPPAALAAMALDSSRRDRQQLASFLLAGLTVGLPPDIAWFALAVSAAFHARIFEAPLLLALSAAESATTQHLCAWMLMGCERAQFVAL